MRITLYKYCCPTHQVWLKIKFNDGLNQFYYFKNFYTVNDEKTFQPLDRYLQLVTYLRDSS